MQGLALDLLNPIVNGNLGWTYFFSRQNDLALGLISPFGIAMIHLGLRQPDRTFEWFERAYRERSDALVYLACRSAAGLDSIGSPFPAVGRRMGIPGR